MLGREGSWRARCAVLALALGACAGPSHTVVTGGPGSAPEMTVQSILAPVLGDGLAELAHLRRLPPSPAVELRRAHVLTEIGDRTGAIEVLNFVLYGAVEPSPPVEAFARYLRSVANGLAGNSADAAADRERAIALAVDSELLGLLGAPAEPPPPVAEAPAPPPAAGRPSILPRTAWGARPARRADQRPMEKPHRITIHHTAIATHSASLQASAAQIFSVQGGHQEGEGWADIGYHYLIDRAGRIWEGRPLRWQGAHAGGDHNRGNIGVCVLGRFLRGADGQEPSAAQAAALERALRWLCEEHSIDPQRIYFHREFKSTECPGPRLETVVDGIRRRMQQLALR